jgi:hypothetical protein
MGGYNRISTGVYYPGEKLFNKLPIELKQVVQYPSKFNSAFKNYSVAHHCYNVDEFCFNE